MINIFTVPESSTPDQPQINQGHMRQPQHIHLTLFSSELGNEEGEEKMNENGFIQFQSLLRQHTKTELINLVEMFSFHLGRKSLSLSLFLSLSLSLFLSLFLSPSLPPPLSLTVLSDLLRVATSAHDDERASMAMYLGRGETHVYVHLPFVNFNEWTIG